MCAVGSIVAIKCSVNGAEQAFFLAGAGDTEIDSGEDAAVSEFSGEANFPIAGALEFFVDNFIQAATSLHKTTGDNSEAATFFQRSCCSKDPATNFERMSID